MNRISKIIVSAIAVAALSGAVSACGSTDGSTSPTPAPTAAAAPLRNAPAKKTAPKETVSQHAAVQSAESYLELGGFSKAGLTQQLSSSAGEGFSKADAEYAVGHVDVDWDAQALDSAKSYMELGGFSRTSLLEQLTSSAGDGFTQAQAEYAVDHVGL